MLSGVPLLAAQAAGFEAWGISWRLPATLRFIAQDAEARRVQRRAKDAGDFRGTSAGGVADV